MSGEERPAVIETKHEADGYTIIRDGYRLGRVVKMQPGSWAAFPWDGMPTFHLPSRLEAVALLIRAHTYSPTTTTVLTLRP